MSSRDGSFLRNLDIEMWGALMISFLVTNVGFDVLFFTPILYLFIRPFSNGGPVFRTLTNWLMHWLTPSIIGPPFSWCGMRVMMDDFEIFEKGKKRNLLVLSNHGGRVDWVGAQFLGWAAEPVCRVNFVVESFMKWMPAVGWHCYWICEDIFVNRSFKQDRVNISKTVSNMRRAGHASMLFLAPEGMIVDTTSKRNAIGRAFLKNCRDFCREHGYPKFEYVLTPRYKGISVLKDHSDAVGGKTISAVMVYTRDGKMLNQKLDSPEREIPDLYDVYAGIFGSPIYIWVHTKEIKLCDDPAELKKIMMEDYARKDKLLKFFDEHGHFPDRGRPFKEMKVPHLRINILTFAHTLSVILIMEVLNLRFVLIYGFGILLFSLCVFNTVGRIIFGYTIESVPFETSIKPLLHFYYELFNSKLITGKRDDKIN